MTEQPRSTRSREAGQAIVLIAFVFIGLLAAVGLVVDLGRYLVAQTQLRRAADAAALAGAAQFRLTASDTIATVYNNVNTAARDTLRAHNVAAETLASGVSVTTCQGDGAPSPGTSDPALCTSPPTKKVRVQINEELPLIFLSLIGWRSVAFSADATTEAAAIDVALVIDISDSMANDTCGGGDYPCQYACENDPANPCQPMQKARDAALAFLNFLSLNFDRVTVIPFGVQAGYCINPGDDPTTWSCPASAYDPPTWNGNKYVPLTLNLQNARDFITNLAKIAIPPWAGNPPTSPIPPCPRYNAAEGWDPRQCTNTNIGGGLRAAASELLKEFDPNYPGGRPNNPLVKERLRVIILLTDGSANASGLGAEGPDYGTGLQLGFCPQSTWNAPPPPGPFCRAAFPGFTIAAGRHISGNVEYDAVDYTLDWADFAFLQDPIGNDIVAFTIGLGNQVISAPSGDPVIGEKLLRYMAAAGDDGDLSTDPCAGVPNSTLAAPQSCGNYYFAPTGDQLLDIFRAIAGRIFTRINQ